MIKQVCVRASAFTSWVGWLQSIALLAVRLWIAKTFFLSGLVKIKSWDSTIALFTDEYQVPLLSPGVAASMAASAELTLPVLLALGILTPIAALGLLIMTLVIELFVYPGTTEHYYWMLLLGVLITHGSGKIGFDFLILRFLPCVRSPHSAAARSGEPG